MIAELEMRLDSQIFTHFALSDKRKSKEANLFELEGGFSKRKTLLAARCASIFAFLFNAERAIYVLRQL